MKKSVFFPALLILGLIVSTCALTGCAGGGSKQEQPAAAEQYQCPMKCTEEVFDKPGTCPVCKMDLEKVAKS